MRDFWLFIIGCAILLGFLLYPALKDVPPECFLRRDPIICAKIGDLK